MDHPHMVQGDAAGRREKRDRAAASSPAATGSMAPQKRPST